jgi:hypothetical protein
VEIHQIEFVLLTFELPCHSHSVVENLLHDLSFAADKPLPVQNGVQEKSESSPIQNRTNKKSHTSPQQRRGRVASSPQQPESSSSMISGFMSFFTCEFTP